MYSKEGFCSDLNENTLLVQVLFNVDCLKLVKTVKHTWTCILKNTTFLRCIVILNGQGMCQKCIGILKSVFGILTIKKHSICELFKFSNVQLTLNNIFWFVIVNMWPDQGEWVTCRTFSILSFLHTFICTLKFYSLVQTSW